MLTPKEIHDKAQRLWRNGRVLRARLGFEELFPLEIPAGRPTAARLMNGYAEVRTWKEALEARCKCRRGYGYRIEYADLNHRQLGHQRLPRRIIFDGVEDLIAYLGRQAEVGRFARLLSAVLERQPALKIWIEAHPLKLLEYDDHWPRLLAVLEYFRANPRPNRYLRELDIPGVESKFVERHRGLIAELLDSTLPPEAVDEGVSGLARHGFERRYGLKYDQPLVRFRLLDPDLAAGYGSLTDLTIPLSEFITLAPPCRQIYITENKTNGLSFPTLSGSLIVFGLGYGISTLKDIPWFREKEILYWGDIDTHGFAILSQLRGYYPQVRSLLMDRETLERFPDTRGQEEDNQRFVGEPEHLDTEERVFYHQLRDNLLGERIRLEQEKIPFEYLCGKLKLVP